MCDFKEQRGRAESVVRGVRRRADGTRLRARKRLDRKPVHVELDVAAGISRIERREKRDVQHVFDNTSNRQSVALSRNDKRAAILFFAHGKNV